MFMVRKKLHNSLKAFEHLAPPAMDELAKQLGQDPVAIKAYVRDHVVVDLYRGHLRSAETVLAVGRANSLDRALLEQALLAAAGQTAGIRRRQPEPGEVKELVKKALEPDPEPIKGPVDLGREGLDALETTLTRIIDILHQWTKEEEPSRQDLLTRLREIPLTGLPDKDGKAFRTQLSGTDTEEIPEALNRALLSLLNAGRMEALLLRRDQEKKSWLADQVNEIQSRLMPLLEPHRSTAPPTAVTSGDDLSTLAADTWETVIGEPGDVPEAEVHRLILRVNALVLRTGPDENLVEETWTLLEIDRPGPDLDGETLVLSLSTELGDSSVFAGGVNQVLAGMEKHVVRCHVTLPHETISSKNGLVFVRPVRVGLAGAFGIDPQKEALRKFGIPVAAVAEMEIAAPGQDTKKYTRVLFDRRDDPTRPAEPDSLGSVYGQEGYPVYAEAVMLLAISTSLELGGRMLPSLSTTRDRFDRLSPLDYQVELARALFAEGIGSQRDRQLLVQLEKNQAQQNAVGSVEYLRNLVNLLICSLDYYRTVPTGSRWVSPCVRVAALVVRGDNLAPGQKQAVMGVDWLSTEDALLGSASRTDLLKLGITQAVIEDDFLAGTEGVSAVRVTNAALANDIPFLLVRDGDAAIDELRLPAAAKYLLRSQLSQGNIAVIPQRPVLLEGRKCTAWWLYHPGSGILKAVLDNGINGVVEYIRSLRPEFFGFLCSWYLGGPGSLTTLIGFSTTLVHFAGEVLKHVDEKKSYSQIIRYSIIHTKLDIVDNFLKKILACVGGLFGGPIGYLTGSQIALPLIYWLLPKPQTNEPGRDNDDQ